MVMWLQTRWNFRNSHPDTPTTFTAVAHCTGRRRAKKNTAQKCHREYKHGIYGAVDGNVFPVTLPGRFARRSGQNLVRIQFVWMNLWDTRNWGFKIYRRAEPTSISKFEHSLIIKLKNWRLWYSPSFIAHRSQMLSIYFLYFCLLSLDDSRAEVIRH